MATEMHKIGRLTTKKINESKRNNKKGLGFLFLWHISLCGLFNAKAILVEGQKEEKRKKEKR